MPENILGSSLGSSFESVYTKFKLAFYRKIFIRFEAREASLTAVETFCVEVIHALGEPTITEFARFVMISQSNAAYKIQSLIKKGYVEKVRSDADKREYTLRVTDKFHQYYRINYDYLREVAQRINNHFSEEELKIFARILHAVDNDLMPEIALDHNIEQETAPEK